MHMHVEELGRIHDGLEDVMFGCIQKSHEKKMLKKRLLNQFASDNTLHLEALEAIHEKFIASDEDGSGSMDFKEFCQFMDVSCYAKYGSQLLLVNHD
jgi:hypothetical protein